MESKFFSEIEKKINISSLKEFESEIRIKINTEFDKLRKKNENLSRILMVDEMNSWNKIKNGEYDWLELNPTKTKKLFRLIDIYSKYVEVIEDVKGLDGKLTKVLELKEAPEEE